MTGVRFPSGRARLGVAVLLQALLVAGAVAPQLSARLTGDEILLEVAPLDPIEPFRGAYVTLDYPGLPRATDRPHPTGTVFVTLRQGPSGEVWRGESVLRSAPDSGRYLRCSSDGFALHCGIESLFASQAQAQRMEQLVADGALARVLVDGRGNAAVRAVLPAR